MNNRNHYKSWSSLNQQLTGLLCNALKDRITYFCTTYSEVHNAYGRAAIRLDGKELVQFTWDKHYEQTEAFLKSFFDHDCILGNYDFLNAVSAFREINIADALISDDCMIRILAILDRRCGKRTLQRLIDSHECDSWPDWAKQFAIIRFEAEKLPYRRMARI